MRIIVLSSVLILVCCFFGCEKKMTEPHNFTPADTVATPVFNAPSGTYFSTLLITLKCSTPDAIIKYTIEDFFFPDTTTYIYTEPIHVSHSQTIRAQAFKTGRAPSAVVMADYNIRLLPIEVATHFYSISATPDTIYADNGLTFSTIKTKVVNGEGSAVQGQPVKFRASMGNIIQNITTDELGFATSIFWSEYYGISTITASLQVFDEYYPDSLLCADTDIVQVVVAGVPPISSIALQLPTTQNPFPMTTNQIITIRAKPRNILGHSVPDNTMVTFTSDMGYFIDIEGTVLGDSLDVPTQNDWATTHFKAGSVVGAGIIEARLTTIEAKRDIQITSPPKYFRKK